MSENLKYLLFYTGSGFLEYVCKIQNPCDKDLVPHTDCGGHPSWSIFKLIYDGSDNLIETYYANGSASFDKIADERENYKYSDLLNTKLEALRDVSAGTTCALNGSSLNYDKTGDDGSVGATAGDFNDSLYMQVKLDGVILAKGTEVTWVSTTSINITQAVTTGQIIRVYS